MNFSNLLNKTRGTSPAHPETPQAGLSRSTLDLAQARASSNVDPLAGLADLRASHEARIQAEQDTLRQAVANANSLLVSLGPEDDTKVDLVIALDGIAARVGLQLSELVDAIRVAKEDLEHCRLRHGLSHRPEEGRMAIGVLLLALMVFIEGGINSSFFMNAHMVAGPFAALLTSVLISSTNILVSALAGFHFGRYLHFGEKAPDRNAIEFVKVRRKARRGLMAYLTVITGFHLTVGLIRSGEALERVEHGLAAYWALLTSPEATFLVLTGVGFSALAYHKGKHLDESYPEYGAMHRRVLALRDDLLDLHESAIEEIGNEYDDAISNVNKQSKAHKDACKQYNQAVGACIHAKGRVDSAIAEAKSALQSQVATLTSAFKPKRGRKPKGADDALAQLTNFDSGSAITLPEYLPMPEIGTQKAALAQSRAKALQRLNTLFHGALATDFNDMQGDDS